MFRVSTSWLAMLVMAAVPATWFGGCQQKNAFQSPPPPEVTVARPIERPVADTVQFTGTTEASAKVDLRSQVTGYLKKITFKDGADVKKGELLFVIDQAPFEAKYNSAEANLQKAEAELKLAQSSLRRIQNLYNRSAATETELESQQAQAASKAADVKAAEAAKEEAKLELDYTEIHAPIDGRIGRHLVDVGNLVESDQTLLATIESIEPIYAYFDVSESELLKFREMLRKNELPNPEKHPPALYLGLSDEQGYPHQGHLDFRQLGVDPETGTILRRGVFPNQDRFLIPGLFVRIQATVGEPVKRLLVEERAIGTDQRGSYLLVLSEENKVEYRPVQLGISTDGMRVIRKGVGPQDWVIVDGLQRARPGESVRPKKEKMIAPAGALLRKKTQPPSNRSATARRNDVLCFRDFSSNVRSSPM